MIFNYFDVEHVLEIHDYIILKSGGRRGLLNKGLLESVLEHIKNDLYYPKLEDKVCHLFYSINKNHAFNDGNKRASISISAYFLQINGAEFMINTYITEMENIAVSVAENKISRDLLYDIIYDLIYNGEFKESTKIKIMNALK